MRNGTLNRLIKTMLAAVVMASAITPIADAKPRFDTHTAGCDYLDAELVRLTLELLFETDAKKKATLRGKIRANRRQAEAIRCEKKYGVFTAPGAGDVTIPSDRIEGGRVVPAPTPEPAPSFRAPQTFPSRGGLVATQSEQPTKKPIGSPSPYSAAPIKSDMSNSSGR